MIHPDTEIRKIDDEMGVGVFATRPIPRGTIVWTLCAFDRVFSADEVARLPAASRAILDVWGYVEADGRRVLCWDGGRFLNHSCEPSMLSVGRHHEVAVRDVAVGEQLTCEYGLCNLVAPLACRCGAPGCRGVVRPDDLTEHHARWQARRDEALALVPRVPQPLAPWFLEPAWLDEVLSGARALPPLADALYRAAP